MVWKSLRPLKSLRPRQEASPEQDGMQTACTSGGQKKETQKVASNCMLGLWNICKQLVKSGSHPQGSCS